MQDETRKIMHLPTLRVSATCVRVPVYRAHSVAVTAEFERPVSIQQAREVLSKAPGLDLVDEPHSNHYPMESGMRSYCSGCSSLRSSRFVSAVIRIATANLNCGG